MEDVVPASDDDDDGGDGDDDDDAAFGLCLSGWYFNARDLCAALIMDKLARSSTPSI